MWMFGGFRLWHGYASDNSWENDWDSHDVYPAGGYLNDMWTYKKKLLDVASGEEVPTESPGYGVWKNITSIDRCFDTPGDLWSERNDRSCEIDWPKRRAGHVMELDKTRNGAYVVGYRIYACSCDEMYLPRSLPTPPRRATASPPVILLSPSHLPPTSLPSTSILPP